MHIFNLNIHLMRDGCYRSLSRATTDGLAVPMDRPGMVPDHSFFQAISSCLVAILPDKFYHMVDQGSIVLKKAKSFSFCRQGVTVEGEPTPIKSDVVIFATGYKGDQKLKEMFASSLFRDIVTGSPSNIIPLYSDQKIVPFDQGVTTSPPTPHDNHL